MAKKETVTEKREEKREEYGDIYDVVKDTMKVHSKTSNTVTKDFNLAIRNAKEDRFITKHEQIIVQVERFIDPEKIKRQYASYDKNVRPSEEEIKEEMDRIRKEKEKSMMILRNDINILNVLCRNRDGIYFKHILKAVTKGMEDEKDVSALENMPLLGGLFKRGEKKEE